MLKPLRITFNRYEKRLIRFYVEGLHLPSQLSARRSRSWRGAGSGAGPAVQYSPSTIFVLDFFVWIYFPDLFPLQRDSNFIIFIQVSVQY